MKRLGSLGLFLFLVSCASAPAPQTAHTAPQSVHIVIAHTTDVHGWFAGHTETQKGTTTARHYGGVAILNAYLNALRAANPGRVVVVDSGDLFQGTLESNLFEGEPVIGAYNAIGYAAAAVGNHEFDYGPVGPDPVVRHPGEDPLGALKKNAAAAKFPFLSANITEKATGRTPAWAKPSVLVDVDGVKLGIIGLTTPDTPNSTVYANVASLDFGNPLPATIREAKALRAAGADAVIVIAHMGGNCKDVVDIHDNASCVADEEGFRFLNALPPGTIDVYFGGHTHQSVRQIINGTAAIQAPAYSRSFDVVDLYVDTAAHHVVASRTNLRPLTMLCAEVYAGTTDCDPLHPPKDAGAMVPRVFDGTTIVPDAKIAAVVQPYLDRTAAKRNEPLHVTTTARFTRNSRAESTIGDLLSDLLRESTGADIGIMNSGGIRADLRAGDLVYSDVFEVSPFDNVLAVVTMSGADLREVLRLTTSGERSIMQVSGIHYTFDNALDAGKPFRERNRLVSVTLADGRPLDPNALYRVAMPDFLANGGDGFDPVTSRLPKERIMIDQNRNLREVFIEAMQKRGAPIAPAPMGRITVLNPASRSSGSSGD